MYKMMIMNIIVFHMNEHMKSDDSRFEAVLVQWWIFLFFLHPFQTCFSVNIFKQAVEPSILQTFSPEL